MFHAKTFSPSCCRLSGHFLVMFELFDLPHLYVQYKTDTNFNLRFWFNQGFWQDSTPIIPINLLSNEESLIKSGSRIKSAPF